MYCDKDRNTAFVFERFTCFKNETRVLVILIYASLNTDNEIESETETTCSRLIQVLK